MSVKFRMNLGGHHFSQNANQKLQGFLAYQTNKQRSTFFGDFLVSVGSFFGYDIPSSCQKLIMIEEK